MRIGVLILGALVATACADHRDGPSIPNMPDLNKLNNVLGGKVPEIPPGMKLEDLKEAFYNMPPSMKDRLNEMAQSFGMQLDDVEDALNNPPEKLKEYFDKNAGASPDGTFKVPNVQQGAPLPGGLDIGSMMQNMDLGAMGNMLKGMDIEGIMKNMDMGAMADIMKNVDIGSIVKNMDLGPMGDIIRNVDIDGIMKNIDIGSMMKNIDLGAITGMMQNMDIGSMMKNMDLGAIGDMAKNIDIGGLMQNMGPIADIAKNVNIEGVMKNMDLGPIADIAKNVDIGGIMKNMDMGAMGDIMKNVDIGGIMKNMDMGAMGDIMKNVDIGGIMKNMDMGAMGDIMKNVDIGGIMKNMDMGAIGDIMKNVDIGGIMKNMDMGAIAGMMGNMDMGAISGMMKNLDMGAITDMMKNFDLGAITGMVQNLGGIGDLLKGRSFNLDTILDLKDLAWEYLESKGMPVDDPMKFLDFIHDKLKSLPLPPGMDASTIMNMLHGQLEAMGFPEDKTKIKDWLLEQAGLVGIKDIEELKDPEILSRVMMKKAFKMLGINEDEDPEVVKGRIIDQLTEEANKLGASISKDSTPEDLMKEMDKVLTKHLNEMVGINADAFTPGSIHRAALDKLQGFGIPVHDFGSLKKFVMDKVMKQLMKSAVPMIMNFIFPKPRPQPPMPPMPPMTMMPPMMPQQPPTIPINLDIAVNVEQPEPRMMPMPMPMPTYLQGAESALNHPDLDELTDEEMFHHIMAVREGLMTGEMPEEILQEMIEDLMTARLRARVLTVRNMFLQDRLDAMEHELDMLKDNSESLPQPRPQRRHHPRPQPRQSPPTREQQQNPLLRALLKPRVL